MTWQEIREIVKTAERVKKELIDKACEWLAIKGIWSGNTCGELKEYIEDFRKAMEE